MKQNEKNVLILCHYAQQPPYNTMLRYHNWGKQLCKRGISVKIVAASTVHNTDIDVIEKIGKETDVVDDVNYEYIKTPRYSGNGFARMKNMLMYAMKLGNLKNEKPDIVIVCEAYLLLFAKKIFKKVPIVTDIVDLWPTSIVEYAGFSESNPIIRLLYFIEKKAYLKSDAIIFSMEGGRDYVAEQSYAKKIDFNKIFHINMGCDVFEADQNREMIHEELPWDFDKYNIVYCGSVRRANNIQQICDAAKKIGESEKDKIFFHIYGNGDEQERLEVYCKDNGISNIRFYGRIEKAKIPYVLSKATANILTYKQVNLMKYGGSQSKLFDYLVSGRPIICNAKFGYNLITRYNCGVVTENQTSEAFAKAVLELCNMDSNKLAEMGRNARRAAEEYDQPFLVDKLMEVFDYIEKEK